MIPEYFTRLDNTQVWDSQKNDEKSFENTIVGKSYKEFLTKDAAHAEKVDILLELDYIHENLLSPSLCVKQVITKCRIRTHVFHKRFADEVALSSNVRRTPGKYIEWARIQVARRILDNNNGYYMAELAYKVGFGSYRTFYRACRKHLGCKPSDILGMSSEVR